MLEKHVCSAGPEVTTNSSSNGSNLQQTSALFTANPFASTSTALKEQYPGVSEGTSAKDGNSSAFAQNRNKLGSLDTSATSLAPYPAVVTHHCRTPSDAGLRLQTDSNALNPYPTKNPLSMTSSTSMEGLTESNLNGPPSLNGGAVGGVCGIGAGHNPLLKSAMSAASLASSISPRSALSSPSLHALVDLTPLPSPLLSGESPGPWRRATVRPTSSGSNCSLHKELFSLSTTSAANTLSPSPVQRKSKPYKLHKPFQLSDGGAVQLNQNEPNYGRNRSISESTPDVERFVKPRHVTVTGGSDVAKFAESDIQSRINREEHIAVQRGLTGTAVKIHGSSKLPSPPPSSRSATESEDGGEDMAGLSTRTAYLSVRCGPRKKLTRWRPIRQLGQGTFSKVILATSEKLEAAEPIGEDSVSPTSLVAIKVISQGTAGGSNEERMALSLTREVEIMHSVRHPSIIRLRAFELQPSQALLVLSYAPGGDLFTLASDHRILLVPELVQRIFAELVSAVRHLHAHDIVHRDIKLENVLFNLHPSNVPLIPSFSTHPYPIITLTDLGLSRRIPPPPAIPLLTTRCGSEDYAAPELILGQPYDGRTTDAWALGVLLYALMEGRLPFDQLPPELAANVRGAGSRTLHRIARCEWYWCELGDGEGVWDESENGPGKKWQGAREVVGGLLKKVSRGRMSLETVAGLEWVKNGICVKDGLRFMEDDDGHSGGVGED